jgi:hypothetical protein
MKPQMNADERRFIALGVYRARQAVFICGAVLKSKGIIAKRAESAKMRLRGVVGA